MFQLAPFPLTPYEFRSELHIFNVEGFPIQRSPDQSLLSSSPKLIAAMPRLSSVLGAKTSTIDPFYLDHPYFWIPMPLPTVISKQNHGWLHFVGQTGGSTGRKKGSASLSAPFI